MASDAEALELLGKVMINYFAWNDEIFTEGREENKEAALAHMSNCLVAARTILEDTSLYQQAQATAQAVEVYLKRKKDGKREQ